MRKRNQNGASAYEVITYSLPKLHTGKTWFVDFQCFDPAEGKMRRKKYHLDSIKSVRERRQRAQELIVGLTAKLKSGWNVWVENGSSRQYTVFDTVCRLYISNIEILLSREQMKKSTYASYTSYMNVFMQYVVKRPFKVVYAYQFNKGLVSDFLDYMYFEQEVSARTRNNYQLWLSSFSEWMVQKDFIEENPVKGIKRLKNEPKQRVLLSEEQLEQLRGYLEKENPYFLLACMLEYYTFIRPNELCYIRIRDISVKEQSITLSGSFTKNGKDAKVGLNEACLKKMIELGIFEHDGKKYLFGDRKFRPSYDKQEGRIFREAFVKMRRALRWPAGCQFYSLKGSGIRDLANATGIVIARDQARHTDIRTTNEYVGQNLNQVHKETKKFAGKL